MTESFSLSEVKKYLEYEKRMLNGANEDVETAKKWLMDLLNESDSTIVLNIGSHATRYASALSRKLSLQREIEKLEDLMSYWETL